MSRQLQDAFHGSCDATRGISGAFGTAQAVSSRTLITTHHRALTYHFFPHFHPYVAALVRRLIEKSIPGLQAADTDYRQKPNGEYELLADGRRKPILYEDFFASRYEPASLLPEGAPTPMHGTFVGEPLPVKDLDFTSSGAYAVYNWELFFHAPLAIAIQLSRNQCYEEARRWFHYIFDPTDDSDLPSPERFWKVRPFQTSDVKMIEEILINLSTHGDPALWLDTFNCIQAWKDSPFRPHLVARYRPTAYMLKAVMAYLDNLIAWGDSLFRQDTGEAINEATQLYVLAANILGPRPQAVPKKGSIRPHTYASLKQDLDALGNALVDLESDIPFDVAPHPGDASDSEPLHMLSSVGRALYFCTPRNDKLLSYWDTVADRLFKIRNSLNIQGIFRQLPLFEPPIDPALLARAAAAGLDVGAIVSGMNQPLPLVRFQLLAQKAAEVCQEVKSLGANLLAAIEKEDNEALAVLRAKHEGVILGMAEVVKYSQWQEAIKAREGVEKSLAGVKVRYTYYERLLGRAEGDIAVPDLDDLDTQALQKLPKVFRAEEPEVPPRPIEVDIAADLGSADGKKISSYEQDELDELDTAQDFQDAAVGLDTIAEILRLLPDFSCDIEPFGIGVDFTFGGHALADNLRVAAMVARGIAAGHSHDANLAFKIGGYARREQEWAFQSNLAAAEINQIFKQLRAAQIREAIALWEWKNHKQQMKQAEEIAHFLSGEETLVGDKKYKKTSTQAFYAWMRREVKGLYAQSFQFAFDVAKKAERALRHELGDPQLSFLEFGYLAGKEGLLAGEKLHLDIRRMEMAYHELNRREYELTKHVSLLQVDPLALIQLRATGRCTVCLPEALFDMDGPGHYFRRIKTVAVSIPCVTGPYASINCTLTLLKSSIRTTQILREGVYAREGAEDDRFSDYFGSLQSIVTSSAQTDSGLFETNLRDERYLPFENSGVISEWQLQLPADPSKNDPAQFDYNTISDVILHIRYTAREGGGLLRNGATAYVKELLRDAQAVGSVRLFSVRHEFPTEWAKFRSQTPAVNQRFELVLNLRPEHYPFWSKGRLNSVARVDILARGTKDLALASVDVFDKLDTTDATAKKDTLAKDPAMGNLLVGKLTHIGLPAKPDGQLRLFFDANPMADLWIAVTWSE